MKSHESYLWTLLYFYYSSSYYRPLGRPKKNKIKEERDMKSQWIPANFSFIRATARAGIDC